MSDLDQTRRRFLSAALRHSAALAASSATLGLLWGCKQSGGAAKAASRQSFAAKWALQATLDQTTGLPLLKLPPGFRYFTFGWAGSKLESGDAMPTSADGMGLIGYDGQRARFIRNQEIWEDFPAFAQSDRAYDVGAGGGTVFLEVDLSKGEQIRASANLTGTNANCSGGVTPWNSWLSGEEQVVADGEVINSWEGRPMTNFKRPHGFMFEAFADRAASGSYQPIIDMGQMRHEAAAVDLHTGDVYLTEDNNPAAGLFRFIPKVRTQLSAGGRLQMLAVEQRQDLRTGINPGQRFKTRWIDVPDPTRAHWDERRASDGCFMQASTQGGATFTRLEGIYMRGDEVFFTATNGGEIGQGQVFVLRPKQNELELIYSSTDKQVVNFPDAISDGPLQGHFICQDGKEVFPQALYYLSTNGSVTNIALNNLGALDSELNLGAQAEWAGVQMSSDQKWLFANVYTPGFSVAITGPFKEWAEHQSS